MRSAVRLRVPGRVVFRLRFDFVIAAAEAEAVAEAEMAAEAEVAAPEAAADARRRRRLKLLWRLQLRRCVVRDSRVAVLVLAVQPCECMKTAGQNCVLRVVKWQTFLGNRASPSAQRGWRDLRGALPPPARKKPANFHGAAVGVAPTGRHQNPAPPLAGPDPWLEPVCGAVGAPSCSHTYLPAECCPRRLSLLFITTLIAFNLDWGLGPRRTHHRV